MNTSLSSLRNFVLLIFCSLVIAGMVWASGHSDQSGDPPPPCPPDCEECCKVPGSGGPPGPGNPPSPPPSGPPNGPGGNGLPAGPGGPFAASSPHPVHLLNGSVTERVTDISIDGPLGGWKHRRTYNSMLDTRTYNNVSYNINGRRWSNNVQSIYLRRSGNTMELFLTASSKRVFTDNDPDKVNGTYSGPADFNVTLTKSVALSYLVYTLTFLETGEVYIFKEKDPLDPCWGISTYQNDIIPLAERTNLTYLTQGLIGETYFYNNNRQLVLVVTASPQSYFIKYSYYSTGYVSGCLKKIEVYDGSPEDEGTTKTAEAEYLYVDYQNASDYIGTTGDLAQVRVSELLTDGISWDHKYTQYRYYLYDGRGYYQLESVLEPDAIERIIAENSEINVPEDIFNYYSNNYYYYYDGQTLSGGKTISDYSSRVFTYYDYTINTNSNISTVWGTENLSSKYGGNDRNEVPTYPYLGLVKSESVNTGCSSCGGSSSGGLKMNYYYMTLNTVPSNDDAGNPNIVVYLTIEDTLDSADTPLYRTIYGMNWHGIELRRAVIKNPTMSTLDIVCTSRTLNEKGKIIEERSAEAHTLVNTNVLLKQFLNPYNGNSWANDTATLEQSKGIIYITEHDSVTNKKSGSKVKIGSGGIAYYTLATDYDSQGHVAAHYVYPTQTTNREASDRVTTSYSYTYWEDNFKQSIKIRTDTSQAVPVAQNGTGVTAVTQTYYDSYENLRWTRNALGVVTYYGYHPVTLQRSLTVRDVNTASLSAIITTETDNIAAWNGNIPFAREVSLPTAFNQTITTEYDKRGRIFATTNPDGITNYTVSDVKKTLRFSAWDTATQQPVLPINVIERNASGKILESYQLPPTAVVVTNGKPSGISAIATKVTWTKYAYHSNGLLQHVDRYHVIPSSGTGTLGTNFYRTTSIYDTQGRQAATVQFAQAGRWQVDYQIFDWRDRVTEIKRGVAMNPPVFGDLSGAAWLKTVSKTIYNGEHVDKTLSYFDTGANDYTGTKYYYDQWERVRSTPSFAVINGTETLLAPFTVQDYDWRGNVVDVAQFETEPNWNNVVTISDFAATTTGKFSHNRSHYDIHGQVWKTGIFNNVSNSFDETTYKHDLAGQRISTTDDNTTVEVIYDALGRNYETKVLSGTVVKTIQRQEYNVSGNVIGQESLTLNPDETVSINENGTNFVRRTIYLWHDKAGRQIVSADFGSGTTIWANAAKPTRPNAVPENSNADYFVTKYGYSPTTGQVESTTDPKGIITQLFYDALGRETKTVA
ncbi:MAG: hypothetical protein LBG58_02525, partial [Planctomycetaceae bacterium]|nr:hypothetical protein [Planctomycetaceae bacterium]